MSRFLTRLVVVAAVVAATAVSAAVGARAFGPMTVCTKFTGPAWKVTSISGIVTDKPGTYSFSVRLDAAQEGVPNGSRITLDIPVAVAPPAS